jgi:hypothetical protein
MFCFEFGEEKMAVIVAENREEAVTTFAVASLWLQFREATHITLQL